MSTATTEKPESHIPDPSEVKSSTDRSWTASDGVIHKGDKDNPAVNGLLGILTRIGIYDGVNKTTGEAFQLVELDIRTNKGLETFAVSSNKTHFFAALLECAKGEMIKLTATQSKKPTKYGNYSTYVAVEKVDPSTLEAKKVWVKEPGEVEDLIVEARKHPAYAERAKRDDAGDLGTHKGQIVKFLAGKGWAKIDDPEFLEMCAKALGKKDITLADISDDEFGEIRQSLEALKDCPKILVPAKDRLKAKGPIEDDEYDPFA